MPAITIAFSDVRRMPRQMYVETSFVRALMDWTPEATDARIVASRVFYDRAWRDNVKMWTSPLTVEEIVWAFVRRALFAEMPSGITNIGEFKRQRRGDYDRVLIAIQSDVRQIFGSLSRLRISFHFPQENSAFKGNWGKAVVDRARELCCTYAIETADAFHAASAFVGGNSEVVSLDEGFRALDGFTVYFTV